jgi:hypothetical protein
LHLSTGGVPSGVDDASSLMPAFARERKVTGQLAVELCSHLNQFVDSGRCTPDQLLDNAAV